MSIQMNYFENKCCICNSKRTVVSGMTLYEKNCWTASLLPNYINVECSFFVLFCFIFELL